ncbi:cysteine desulfurase [Candidatus Micrarchaeota archaeon]|jgi:cysteine desulfurase|nr:cysteine desulfurase [Candidatus Micrarchaeota archaeon]
MKKRKVYMDNSATTMVDPTVVKEMKKHMTISYGNPASLHYYGEKANQSVESSRKIIAESINADNNEIYFTSGGTESNNWVLKSIAFQNLSKSKDHIITSKIEHSSVANTCLWLQDNGFKITWLNTDSEGFVDLKQLKESITQKTSIVSIIHGNNEIGTIQDLNSIGKLCADNNVLFHTDACQSHTKTHLDVEKYNVDFVTLNSHKIHGPKGVGALYAKKNSHISVWQHGGGQEFGKRSGTVNVHGIAGFAKAVELASDEKHIRFMTFLRDKLIRGVLDNIPGVKLNGPLGDKRLCNNANFSFSDIEGEAIGGYLNEKGIFSSTGSACSARSLEPSHVLKAIGLSDAQANGSLRLSLSRFNTNEDVDYVINILPEIVKRLRKISPFSNEVI